MKALLSSLLITATLAGPAFAQPQIGKAAPDFTATDANGKSHKLSDFKGKTVVLEWTNPECPFVQKHYNSGNMQALQTDATKDGVVWLSVNSGAPGKQGHVDGAGANRTIAASKARPTAYLLDANGQIGKLYGARTTPHMYVIDAKGTLVYMGGIDSNSSADPATIKTATNYVKAALADLKAGTPIKTATSQPYGCSVKYAG